MEFEDDITLISDTLRGLQKRINALEEYYIGNVSDVDLDKRKVIF